MNDIGVIYLTNGGYTIVDADLFDSLNQFNWQRSSNGGVYRCSSIDGIAYTVLMHRVVNNTPEGVSTDHINGLRFDNRRSNLRNANKSTNAANSTPRKRKPQSSFSSRFKGVYKNGKKWRARIACRETLKHLGAFQTEEQAALAYNIAAIERFGEFAKLNPLPEDSTLGL